MRRLVVAARYLTIVPVPARIRGDGSLGAAAAWFPLVGLGIGAAVAAVERVGGRLFPLLLAALLAITAWKLLTGGLHLDGLADCLDGLVGRDAAHRLEIMRDSRIGAFGAIGLILFLLLEIAAVAELPAPVRWRALLVAPVVGRALPPLLARLFRAARPGGHGARFRDGLPQSAPPLALGVAVLVAGVVLGPAGLVAVAVALAVVLLTTRFLAGRLGGITGDVLGGSIEIGELAVLLALSASAHGSRLG